MIIKRITATTTGVTRKAIIIGVVIRTIKDKATALTNRTAPIKKAETAVRDTVPAAIKPPPIIIKGVAPKIIPKTKAGTPNASAAMATSSLCFLSHTEKEETSLENKAPKRARRGTRIRANGPDAAPVAAPVAAPAVAPAAVPVVAPAAVPAIAAVAAPATSVPAVMAPAVTAVPSTVPAARGATADVSPTSRPKRLPAAFIRGAYSGAKVVASLPTKLVAIY